MHLFTFLLLTLTKQVTIWGITQQFESLLFENNLCLLSSFEFIRVINKEAVIFLKPVLTSVNQFIQIILELVSVKSSDHKGSNHVY